MLCRNCRTEIAEKALICYRCGTATTEPKVKPPPAARHRSSSASVVASTLALALFVLLALYMGRIGGDGIPRLISVAPVAIALVVVVLRAYARRR